MRYTLNLPEQCKNCLFAKRANTKTTIKIMEDRKCSPIARRQFCIGLKCVCQQIPWMKTWSNHKLDDTCGHSHSLTHANEFYMHIYLNLCIFFPVFFSYPLCCHHSLCDFSNIHSTANWIKTCCKRTHI